MASDTGELTPTAAEPNRPSTTFGTPRTARDWAAHTHSHVSSIRSLRKELQRSKLQGSVNNALLGEAGSKTPRDRNTTALEDRLKRRNATEKKLAGLMERQMDSMERTIFQLSQSLTDLQRTSGELWASVNVAEKRLELRAKRPPQELVRDSFQEALEQERAELLKTHQHLLGHITAGQEMRSAADGAKAEMLANRLTFHLDRTNWPYEFLGKTRQFEGKAAQFVATAGNALRDAEGVAARVRTRTAACMKKRMSELVEMRRHLEAEIMSNHCTIYETERALNLIQKVINNHRAAPENRFKQDELGTDEFKAFHSRAQLDAGPLAKLRAKIKSAAYTGHKGRQLDVLFGRFDRDGSGQLDEDEVRRALRRTLKIPPSAITDAEVSALCATLDSDGSGEVSIAEIVEFLNADADIAAMEEQHQRNTAILEELNAEHLRMVENLRCKTAAWRLDDLCSKVTVAKGLELDSLPIAVPTKHGEAPSPKRKKPLEPRVVERVRARLQKAVYSGNDAGQLESLVYRFDQDGSGQLSDVEFRKMIRGHLKVPIYAISDAEVCSLCAMLDSNQSGAVSVEELVDFIGPEPAPQQPDGGGGVGPEPAKDAADSPQGQRRCMPGQASSPEELERVRATIREAAYASDDDCDLDELFRMFNHDGSDRMDEDTVCMVMRRALNIPPSALPEAGVRTLCAALDADASGTVSAAALADFVGPPSPKAGRRPCGRPPNGTALEPIRTA